ncbi:Isopenicillin N synthase-like [Phaffia rhodozyma]|uniref:Isopenicillin N synthase-like n=1 Tax=Phaffia rhodozyma TaxID=264483 RepID=A0A0F7SF57_PHARH|nr:Isopenicillin N synthase-like [Phaffia rhodozyma]
MSIPVRKSSQGAVLISYHDLVENPLALRQSIEAGFGSGEDALGIVVIEDLPSEFPHLRERLLRLINSYANLPEEAKASSLANKSNGYSFGWSHGVEIMNGVPDLFKGSYYNNPLTDNPDVSAAERAAYPMYYSNNVWPDARERDVDGFESSFKELGKFVFNVGCLLSKACESFVSEALVDASQTIENLISTSQCNKARLLHYFSPQDTVKPKKEGVDDDLCGIHLDHSLLTGLCSALYLFHPEGVKSTEDLPPKAVPAPYPNSGLYIIPRSSTTPVRVSIPADCLAFQTGEALQLCTGGKLRATPHYVQAGSPDIHGEKITIDGQKGTVTRETFAFFLQPDVGAIVSKRPDGSQESFGEFSKRILDKHHSF